MQRRMQEFFTGLYAMGYEEIHEGDTILIHDGYDGWFFAKVVFDMGCFGYKTFDCEQFTDRDGLFTWCRKNYPEKDPWPSVNTYGFNIYGFRPLIDHIRREHDIELIEREQG